jgi:hypothetical protein
MEVVEVVEDRDIMVLLEEVVEREQGVMSL